MRETPQFETEDQERLFWSTHDSADFIDWAHAEPAVFPTLKPSTTTISIRLPASLLNALKVLANQRDVPYQSLLKVFLAERVRRESRASPRRAPNEAERPAGRSVRAKASGQRGRRG